MPSFRYMAIAPSGELSRGVMEAASETAVVERLQRLGNLPMRVEPADGGSFLAGVLHMEFGRRSTLRRQEVANITRELAIMLDAGQDLDRALRFLVETAPNARMRTVLERIRDAIRDGGTMAAALGQQPRSFSPLYVGLVRAGEAGGMLAATLGHIATLMERERSLAATVKSALIYPALLVVTAIGSIALLLTEVLPQFVPLFEESGAGLPQSTRILIGLGDVVSNDGGYVLLALAGLFVLGRAALRRPAPRLAADRWLLHLPVLGSLTRDIVAARFSRTLGTLLQNGVSLIAALGIVRDVIGNRAAVAAVDRATSDARGGAGLASSLAVSKIFPTRMIYLLRLGEETAQLGQMALRAAEIHEEATRLNVQRLVSLLVPAITIAMGAAVAGIVASLLMAMLSLNDLAQ
ncbi:MAG: ral secretion pathway protein [Rhodospirillaceae bacterium]|nr:ral secretion pathway protein [Rhodospirillaceae bacterium]